MTRNATRLNVVWHRKRHDDVIRYHLLRHPIWREEYFMDGRFAVVNGILVDLKEMQVPVKPASTSSLFCDTSNMHPLHIPRVIWMIRMTANATVRKL